MKKLKLALIFSFPKIIAKKGIAEEKRWKVARPGHKIQIQIMIKLDYIIDLRLKFHESGMLLGLAISSGWPGTGWLADSCLEFEQYFFCEMEYQEH